MHQSQIVLTLLHTGDRDRAFSPGHCWSQHIRLRDSCSNAAAVVQRQLYSSRCCTCVTLAVLSVTMIAPCLAATAACADHVLVYTVVFCAVVCRVCGPPPSTTHSRHHTSGRCVCALTTLNLTYSYTLQESEKAPPLHLFLNMYWSTFT